jgi:thiamine-monophosphate kinase
VTVDESALGPGAEFDAIRAMLRRLGPHATGVGDDAAVLSVARGDSVVASVDAFVENRHFRRGWLTPREIGRRAVVAAMSDLAAMAARPIGVLLALVLPSGWRAELEALTDGFSEAVAECGAVVIGGNMSDGNELSITTTVLGGAFAPLARSGGRAGDRVYVTGRLGAPAAALERLYRGEDPGPFRQRFARPQARLAEARWLADHEATAAVDVSDGVVADLRHLAAASSVRIELDARRLPCFAGVSVEAALASGEEYELAVTAAGPFDTAAFSQRFGVPLTEIGRVVAGEPAVDVRGARVAAISGHDHFSQ